jgi:hypothetical protein
VYPSLGKTSREIVDINVLGPAAALLLERCMRVYEWKKDKALRVLDAYKQYLHLKKIYVSTLTRLSPPRSVDQMLRQHVLLVSDYPIVFGGSVVDREPSDAHERAEERDERGIATRRAFLTRQEDIGSAYEEWKGLFESPPPLGSPRHCWIPNPSNEATILLYVRSLGVPDGHPLKSFHFRVRVPPTTGRVGDLVDLVFAKAGIRHCEGSCLHEGREIDPNEDFYATPRSLGMRHLSVVDLVPRPPDREDSRLRGRIDAAV